MEVWIDVLRLVSWVGMRIDVERIAEGLRRRRFEVFSLYLKEQFTNTAIRLPGFLPLVLLEDAQPHLFTRQFRLWTYLMLITFISRFF